MKLLSPIVDNKDLVNKEYVDTAIPTVNNATLTIQKNGTTVNTFTANASSNVTANITVPTKTSDLTNDSNYITNTGSTSGNAGTATTLQPYTYNRNNNTNTWFKVATTSFGGTYAEKHAYLFIKGTHNSNYKQNGILALDAVGNANAGVVGSYAAQFMSATNSLDLNNFYIEYKNGDSENNATVNFWIRANTNNYASWQVKILQNSGWIIASSSPTASSLPSTDFTGKIAERVGHVLKADTSSTSNNSYNLLPVCRVGSDVASSNGWYKVATSTLSGYGNQNILYFVKSGYVNGYAGILDFEMRSDSTSITCWKLNWVARHPNLDEGNVIIVISGMTWTMYAYQASTRYGRLYFTELSNRNIDGNANTWAITYFNSDTKESSKPTPTVSSTDGWTVAKAKTADTLTTARTIGIGTGGTGTATSFNGSANITIPLTDVKDSYVSWGGKGLTNNGLSPGDMGCVDEFGHNKLAYLDPACLDVAYSTDGGTTWVDSGLTDAQKIKMMTTSGPMTYSGGSTVATAENVTQLKLRIRLACGTTSGTGKIYTAAKKILFNVTDPNADATMTMRYRTIANYKSDTDTWTNVSTVYDVRGGAGWNSIPFVYTFGGNMSTQTSQIGQFEFVFSNTKLGTWGQNKVGVGDIRLIGASNWTMPSELARAGHIYSLDENQYAYFPAAILPTSGNANRNLGTSSSKWTNVYATTLNGNLSGTIASSTTATTQASGDNSTKVATTAFVTSAIGTVQTPIYSGPTPPSDTSKIWYDTTTNTFMYYDQTSEDWEESNSPDVMSEVLRITGDLQNQINNMDDTVGELQVESATHITQTDAETLVNASASSLSADIQTTYDTLDSRITSLNSNLSTSIQAVDNKYDGYIDIANKGSTDPTLSLSTPTSNLSINTTNSNIKIKSGTNDIVTVNSDKLSSTHLEATETLGMGNFGWVVQTSGHVTLKKLT